VKTDAETGQTVVSGMGELHLEVIRHRLLDEFNVDANVGEPRVAYKETAVSERAAEGRIIQQTGTRGTFAVVRLRVVPASLKGEVVFRSELPAHRIKRRFVSAIETGVLDTARGGVVTGYPLINVEAVLLDAEEHPVDSDDVAFEAAASLALRQAVEKAGAALLEPIMALEVVAPAQYLGDIIADLNGRRAEITHVEERGEHRVVQGHAPLSEMFGYATALRSLTQGRGTYTLEPSDYRPAPKRVHDQWVV
jgi:elongation factor G